MLCQMKEVIYYCLLLPVAVIGIIGTQCTASDKRNLICQFPFNLNSTQSDFGVYFYPDDGGEEPLVDCAWANSELRCIQQEDFECKHPVSEIAEITIPESFGDKNGSYRCVPEGHMHHTVKSCRPPDERDMIFFEACDLKKTSDGHEVIIICSFSVPVDSFTIKQNTIVVSSFSKSACQNSTVCRYSVTGKQHIFTVMLNVTQNPYGDYVCHANHSSLHTDIKGCSFSSYAPDESSPVPVYIVVLPVVAGLTLIAVAVTVLLKLKRMKKTGENKELKWMKVDTFHA